MAYKINSFNYAHIRNSVFKNGVATTSKAYGVDKTTLRYVRDHETFEEYREFIAEKSREQYERRMERQRKRLFGTTVKNGLHFDGNITLNKPVEKAEPKPEPTDKPFETEAHLGIAKTIVTNVERKEEQPKEETRETVEILPEEEKPKQKRTRWPDMTPEMYNKAVEMAREGHLKQEICEALGYPNAGTLNYQLTKNHIWAAGFGRACEEGKEKYKKRWGEATGSHARAVAARQNKPQEADDGLTPYERGLKTGAEKMGVTVEEYKQWRKDKLKYARKKRWEIYNAKREEEKIAPKYKETYAEMVARENARLNEEKKKEEDAKNSEVDKTTSAERIEDKKAVDQGSNVVNTVEDRDGGLRVQEAVDKVLSSIPADSKVSVPMFTEAKITVPTEYAETVLREKEEDKTAVPDNGTKPENLEKRDEVVLCEKGVARGWNSFLVSTGKAVKIVAIGGLALMLAQAAQIIILALK